MNTHERASLAGSLKKTGVCNCTQAVIKVYENEIAAKGMKCDDLMKMASGFAAGMGCLESTCGALIGAVMVQGILSEGSAGPGVSRQMLAGFTEKCGANICKELKGAGTETVLCPCDRCVENAVLVLGEYLK